MRVTITVKQTYGEVEVCENSYKEWCNKSGYDIDDPDALWLFMLETDVSDNLYSVEDDIESVQVQGAKDLALRPVNKIMADDKPWEIVAKWIARAYQEPYGLLGMRDVYYVNTQDRQPLDINIAKVSALTDHPKQIAQLIAAAPEMLEMLEGLEWEGTDWDELEPEPDHCPVCWNSKLEGHADDCALDALLKKARDDA